VRQKDCRKWGFDRQVNIPYGIYGRPPSHRECQLWRAGPPAASGNVGRLGRPFELVVPPLARRGGIISSVGPSTPQQFCRLRGWAVSRLLGRNRRPTVPRVQDPNRSINSLWLIRPKSQIHSTLIRTQEWCLLPGLTPEVPSPSPIGLRSVTSSIRSRSNI
jgi:hypothetical protein